MRGILAAVLWMVCAAGLSAQPGAGASDYFAIRVVDAATGRGVPLVELKTTNDIRYVTDSAGRVAFLEPGLMGRDVYFHISSHGYEYPADGFGYRGKALRTTPGGSVELTINRVNLAERVYRVTGQGIYRDTVLLGLEAPIREPVFNGRVMGQDSVLNAVYKGKLYWFWGDTGQEKYPLGHFRTAGAVSSLPGDGGLDPSVGVDLDYFVDDAGFSRPMAPFPDVKGGLYWLDGLIVLPDDAGKERMIAHASHMESLAKRLDHSLVIYNDETQSFELLKPLDDVEELNPVGHPFEATADGQRYFYFPRPYPLCRVRAEWGAVLDPSVYESFTCLKPGARFDAESAEVERDEAGRVVWAWKAGTSWIDHTRQQTLIDAGKLKADEAWIDTRDVASGDPIVLHGGSVAWNGYRKKWVMIAVQVMGSSLLGEVWYSEADRPEGPWRWARKVVTHNDYSFYNPRQHAYFEQEGGRVIYFEGTYTDTFSGAKFPTPRYNYNQVMYRLDLGEMESRKAEKQENRK
jgi:hypothetical protein